MKLTNLEQREQKGRLLRVKQGYNPNSSSVGSSVLSTPVLVAGISLIIGVATGVILMAMKQKKKKPEEAEPKEEQ